MLSANETAQELKDFLLEKKLFSSFFGIFSHQTIDLEEMKNHPDDVLPFTTDYVALCNIEHLDAISLAGLIRSTHLELNAILDMAREKFPDFDKVLGDINLLPGVSPPEEVAGAEKTLTVLMDENIEHLKKLKEK